LEARPSQVSGQVSDVEGLPIPSAGQFQMAMKRQVTMILMMVSWQSAVPALVLQ
jgi:hypothetical protein